MNPTAITDWMAIARLSPFPHTERGRLWHAVSPSVSGAGFLGREFDATVSNVRVIVPAGTLLTFLGKRRRHGYGESPSSCSANERTKSRLAQPLTKTAAGAEASRSRPTLRNGPDRRAQMHSTLYGGNSKCHFRKWRVTAERARAPTSTRRLQRPTATPRGGAVSWFPAGIGRAESVDLTDRALPEEVIMAASADSLHGYHVHIYYKEETLAAAQALRDRLAASFPVQIGKNAGIAGPHPVSQIQIIFKKEAFQQVVPWLMLNRDGLDILVHPLSDNEYDDHTDYALWMGTPIKLKVETLPHGPYPARLLPAG